MNSVKHLSFNSCKFVSITFVLVPEWLFSQVELFPSPEFIGEVLGVMEIHRLCEQVAVGRQWMRSHDLFGTILTGVCEGCVVSIMSVSHHCVAFYFCHSELVVPLLARQIINTCITDMDG